MLSSKQGLSLDFVETLAELSLKECGDRCIYSFFPGETDHVLSTVLGHRKMIIYKPGRELSQELDHFGTPILNLKSTKLWKS